MLERVVFEGLKDWELEDKDAVVEGQKGRVGLILLL
jgi:hypothetical protein